MCIENGYVCMDVDAENSRELKALCVQKIFYNTLAEPESYVVLYQRHIQYIGIRTYIFNSLIWGYDANNQSNNE